MIDDNLRCLFSGEIEERGDRFVVEIPKQEVDVGNISPGEFYRIALLDASDIGGSPVDSIGESSDADTRENGVTVEGLSKQSGVRAASEQSNGRGSTRSSGGSSSPFSRRNSGPPVEEGEERIVKIEDMGEQGDGLARVERGYIVFVEDTVEGEEVRVRIESTKKNVAFAEVIERDPSSPNIKEDSPVTT